MEVGPIKKERDSGIRSGEQRDQSIRDGIAVSGTGTKGLVSRWDKTAITGRFRRVTTKGDST